MLTTVRLLCASLLAALTACSGATDSSNSPAQEEAPGDRCGSNGSTAACALNGNGSKSSKGAATDGSAGTHANSGRSNGSPASTDGAAASSGGTAGIGACGGASPTNTSGPAGFGTSSPCGPAAISGGTAGIGACDASPTTTSGLAGFGASSPCDAAANGGGTAGTGACGATIATSGLAGFGANSPCGVTASSGQPTGSAAPSGDTTATSAAGHGAAMSGTGNTAPTAPATSSGAAGSSTDTSTGGSNGGTSGPAQGAGGAAAPGGAMFHPCPSDGKPCKIMPFGDSITDGYNADTPGGYRVELFRLAHAAGRNITFVGSGSNGPDTVDGAPFPHSHEGHSGWTIAPAGGRSGISTLVATVMPQYKPHIVLLMIGTNDAIDNYEMAQAPTRLGQLIDSVYAQLPDVTILVAQLIPARGAAAQGDDAELNTRIKTFNEAIPAVLKARADAGKHILGVDMAKPFAEQQRPLFEDQWHPNAAGYVLIGSTWYATLAPLL